MESDPFRQIPVQIRQQIWNYFSLKDLKNIRLVSRFWKGSCTWSFCSRALVVLDPYKHLETHRLSSYVALYPRYLHTRYHLDLSLTTVTSSLKNINDFIKFSFSLEYMAILFNGHGQNVKYLSIKYRPCKNGGRIQPQQVKTFMVNILRECCNLEELELDLDVVTEEWFPSGIKFTVLKSLKLNYETNFDAGDEGEIDTVAQRIMEATPNLNRFSSTHFQNKLEARLLARMGTGCAEAEKYWPLFDSVESSQEFDFTSGYFFGGRLWELSRQLRVLHLGVVTFLGVVGQIMNKFRHSLEELVMTVEVLECETAIKRFRLPTMPQLKVLRFVKCIPCFFDNKEVSATSSSESSSDSDYEDLFYVKGTEPPKRKRNVLKTSKKKRIRVYTRDLLDFCYLSELLSNPTVMEETLPRLHTLQLTFHSPFRNDVYDAFFPTPCENRTFPQIRRLKVDYPKKKWNQDYQTWTKKLTQLFPNVHNKNTNWSREWGDCVILDLD